MMKNSFRRTKGNKRKQQPSAEPNNSGWPPTPSQKFLFRFDFRGSKRRKRLAELEDTEMRRIELEDTGKAEQENREIAEIDGTPVRGDASALVDEIMVEPARVDDGTVPESASEAAPRGTEDGSSGGTRTGDKISMDSGECLGDPEGTGKPEEV
ncbi:hypothetical protein BJ508DRAFT_314456 [Ascobolus immersus RN42]|uniref:Uncharacterized protein n=1 Tax=Ascobolus immersus RN42 TaxID=1160509 RepID=A0A3N4HEX2_ASCIM|nr:hypothetical protein BJ508DRAFT_314456 [Ascobolus immersus RN42]